VLRNAIGADVTVIAVDVRQPARYVFNAGRKKNAGIVAGQAQYDQGEALREVYLTKPSTNAAAAYNGYGTALKPAYEPIIVCRKPLNGTVANNVLAHGTGGINIDGCRVGTDEMSVTKSDGVLISQNGSMTGGNSSIVAAGTKTGRWPANVMHDGCLPDPMDRYYYCAKTSKKDRDAGLETFDHHNGGEGTGREEGSAGAENPRAGASGRTGARNIHPTVKPTELMRWCCRLVGHPGAIIMDPFSGSGSTGRGAILEGFEFIGFELSAEYTAIANARIAEARL